MKELTKEEFLALFDETVRPRIEAMARIEGVEAIVCCEVLQMDSSSFGHRVALAVGEGRTFKLSDVEKPPFRLGDVPSRFQYPTAFWRVV